MFEGHTMLVCEGQPLLATDYMTTLAINVLGDATKYLYSSFLLTILNSAPILPQFRHLDPFPPDHKKSLKAVPTINTGEDGKLYIFI